MLMATGNAFPFEPMMTLEINPLETEVLIIENKDLAKHLSVKSFSVVPRQVV